MHDMPTIVVASSSFAETDYALTEVLSDAGALNWSLEDGSPHFYFSEINGLPLFFIADNLSQGVNRGIDKAFQKAPGDISRLKIRDDEAVFSLKER